MANRLIVVVGILALAGLSAHGQSKPSIQGVWRNVEVTITNPDGSGNPAGLGKGTHTALQPGLLIVSGKHYSLMIDTAAKPRPTTPFKVLQKPTHEEMQSQWGPFQANAGTYELRDESYNETNRRQESRASKQRNCSIRDQDGRSTPLDDPA